MGKEKSDKANEEMAIFAVFVILLFLVLKYIPIVLFGILLGFINFWGSRVCSGFYKFNFYVHSYIFFMLLMWVMVGWPMDLKTTQIDGLFSSSEFFLSILKSIAHGWNTTIGSFAKGTVIKVSEISFLDVSRYFWSAFIPAILINTALELNCRFRDASSFFDTVEKNPFRLGFSVITFFNEWLFARWQRFVRFSFPWDDGFKWLLIRLLGIASFLFLVPYLLYWPIEDKVAGYRDLYLVLTCVKYTPLFGFASGLVIAFIENVLGIDLRGAKKAQQNQFTLGYQKNKRPYYLTEKNLSYHVEIIAPTGSGKTNLLKNLISIRIQKGHGIIFLDLKADFEVVEWMLGVAEQHQRKDDFRLISLSDRSLSVPYNPIKSGTAPEIQSQLMNAMTWSEDYYRKISSIALMTLLRGLCEYRDKTGELFHLWHVYRLLNDPMALRLFIEKLYEIKSPMTAELMVLAEKLDRPSEKEKLTGLIANLNLLIYSSAGELLTDDVERGTSFDFNEAINQKRITYFLMNSLKLKESAKVIGKMILQDLMRFVGDRYAKINRGEEVKPVTLIIDEFASFAMPEFIEFMDRSRGAGIGIVIAHQSRADLREISPEFQERVEANSNTVIISGKQSPEDAEFYASMLGTKTVKKETIQVKDELFFETPTGVKSVRDVEEFIVHPNELKDLTQGNIFTISRTIDPKWGLLKVPIAEQATFQQSNFFLGDIRENYRERKGDRYLKIDLTKTPKKPIEKEENKSKSTKEINLWD